METKHRLTPKKVRHPVRLIVKWQGFVFLLILAFVTGCLPPCANAAGESTEDALRTLLEQAEDRDVEASYRIEVDPEDLAITEGLSSEWRNILLLGTDTDSGLNYGRTDAMLILSIHTKTGAVKITSLARDMWVDIPDLKLSNRINTANWFGGPYLAMKTVNTVLELNIRNYLSINFSGLEKVIDIVGGVSLELTKEEAGVTGARIRNGKALLNGEQALAYARIRKLDSNFGRNERQRKLLEALFRKVMDSSDAVDLLRVFSEILPYMATNLKLSDILILAATASKNKDLALETLSLPQTGDYHYDSADGKSKVIFEQEATATALHRFVYGTD